MLSVLTSSGYAVPADLYHPPLNISFKIYSTALVDNSLKIYFQFRFGNYGLIIKLLNISSFNYRMLMYSSLDTEAAFNTFFNINEIRMYNETSDFMVVMTLLWWIVINFS